MDSFDESEECAASDSGRKRRSTSSHSCGRWQVDTESLTDDILADVGLALMDDSSGLPTPPDSQAEATPVQKAFSEQHFVDPYSVVAEDYVPEGFLVYKRRKLGTCRTYDPFCCLSSELMLRIFGYLAKWQLVRCARVCRRWRQLAFDEALWRRVDAASRVLPAGTLGQLVQRGVRYLRLARSEISTPLFLDGPDPVEFTSKLVYLDLSMAVISEEGVEQLLATCRRLQKLSLERCALSDAACASIAANRELNALNCALCTGLTPAGLEHILNGCRRLEELNLGWTELPSAAFTVLAASLTTSVVKLNISGGKDELTDAQVQQLLRRVGARLRVLDLSDATSISQGAFDAMLQYLVSVEHIALSRCYNIPAVSCLQLGQLTSLLYMDMYNCFNEAGVETLRRALPRVQVNTQPYSTVARPTVGNRRTSIWEQRVRD